MVCWHRSNNSCPSAAERVWSTPESFPLALKLDPYLETTSQLPQHLASDSNTALQLAYLEAHNQLTLVVIAVHEHRSYIPHWRFGAFHC